MSKAVSCSDMSPGSKAMCSAKHPGTPSVDNLSQFFFQAKFCLAKKHCTILKLLTTLPVSKREMGLFLWWHQHEHNKQKQGLAALENVVSFVEETSVSLDAWSAVKYQKKCQQLHSESHNSWRTLLQLSSPAPSYSQRDHSQGTRFHQDPSGCVWLLSFFRYS